MPSLAALNVKLVTAAPVPGPLAVPLPVQEGPHLTTCWQFQRLAPRPAATICPVCITANSYSKHGSESSSSSTTQLQPDQELMTVTPPLRAADTGTKHTVHMAA